MEFLYNDVVYNINIIRKNNKNLYIKVDDDLNIIITCPYLYTNMLIKRIIKRNSSSVEKMIENQLKKKENNDKYKILGKEIDVIFNDVKIPVFKNNTLIVKDVNMLNKWYLKIAKEKFLEYLDKVYNIFDENIPYPKLKIRKMKTRWGVCNKKNITITLNLDLITKDDKYLEYVIIHELSHFIHFNHSKSFWDLVRKYCPSYIIIRKEMKTC